MVVAREERPFADDRQDADLAADVHRHEQGVLPLADSLPPRAGGKAELREHRRRYGPLPGVAVLVLLRLLVRGRRGAGLRPLSLVIGVVRLIEEAVLDPRGDVVEAGRRRPAREARQRPRTVDAHLDAVGDAVVEKKVRNSHVGAGATAGPHVSVARTADPVEPVRRVEFQRARGRGAWDVRDQRELTRRPDGSRVREQQDERGPTPDDGRAGKSAVSKHRVTTDRSKESEEPWWMRSRGAPR